MKVEFRYLKADEIETRVSTIKQKGCSLLLYKDARVDQSILDETVGCMNWQRHHSRDNANCIVSIYDEDKKIWVEKEDTGSESNTEAKKGLASDSFKRAWFNWGIGRELYTKIFIWINLDPSETQENGKDKYGKAKYKLDYKTKFHVEAIESDNGKIVKLAIKDQNGKRRFVMK